MPNYKNVRLEDHVYQELMWRQKPRESMSQVIERVLSQLKAVAGRVEELDKILWGDKQ